MASKVHEEKILERQCTQARIADVAIYLHAMACTLSRLDMQIRDGQEGPEFERDKAAALHFLKQAEVWIRERWRQLEQNADDSMRTAAEAEIAHNDALPNKDFAIPEASPVAKGTGRRLNHASIQQFPGDGFESPSQTEGAAAQ